VRAFAPSLTQRLQMCPALRVLDVSGWPMTRDGPLLKTVVEIITRVREIRSHGWSRL
jgi:hypothetical protein